MRVAIVGSRSFNDYELMKDKFLKYFGNPDKIIYDENDNLESQSYYRIEHIVSGGAKGADTLGAKLAKEFSIKLIEHLPDWDQYGKAAGHIRNELIIADCDVALIFWNGVKKNSGTLSDINICKRLKKDTIIIYF